MRTRAHRTSLSSHRWRRSYRPPRRAPAQRLGFRYDNLDRATAFYTETLGLPLIARFGPLVFVDLGGTRLLLDESAPPALLYLRVDGLEQQVGQAKLDAMRANEVVKEGYSA